MKIRKLGFYCVAGLCSLLLNGRPAHSAVVHEEILERGPHDRVVDATLMVTNLEGKITTAHVRYTEVGTGMHYQHNGQWLETQETIKPHARGAAALDGQYQVIFGDNLNRAGVVELITPDHQKIEANILGLAWNDPASGRSVLLATVKDCAGELVSSNQVVYQDAFDGILADVRYTYLRGSFEADVILRENPQLPSGMDVSTAFLQVMTEFSKGPQPKGKAAKAGEEDLLVDFGTMQLIKGRAFALANSAGELPTSEVPVFKSWQLIDGRHILFENMRYAAAKTELEKLPQRGALRQGAFHRGESLPARPAARGDERQMQMAKAVFPVGGFVIDWIAVPGGYSSSSYTFAADNTYLISSPTYFGGPITLFEGTVIKFETSASLFGAQGIYFQGNEASRKAVCTHKNDNSVGEPIGTGNVGSARYPYALGLYNPPNGGTLFNLDIRYANVGVEIWNPGPRPPNPVPWYYVYFSVFRSCNYGIGASGYTVILVDLFMFDLPFPQGDHIARAEDAWATFYGLDQVVLQTSGSCMPSITSQSSDVTRPVGGYVNLSVQATGPNRYYQWFKDNVSLAGEQAKSAYLRVPLTGSMTHLDAGRYYVRVWNECGLVKSADINVTVTGAPYIVTQPASLTLPQNSTARFFVSVLGNGPFTYQWYKDGSPIGTDSYELVLPNISPGSEGTYSVKITDVNSLFTTSSGAMLTVVANNTDKTYTGSALTSGQTINLGLVSSALTINSVPKPLSYINVACGGSADSPSRGTMARVNVNSGQIVGEYLTSPVGSGASPSRTTVDRQGNVWIGNRDDNTDNPFFNSSDSRDNKGSVTRIGMIIGGTRGNKVNGQFVADANGEYLKPPFVYNTCVDRDHDGLIHTSRGLNQLIPWGTAYGVATAGNYTFVADSVEGLIVIDTSAPSTPHVVAKITTYLDANGSPGTLAPYDVCVDTANLKGYVAMQGGMAVFSLSPDYATWTPVNAFGWSTCYSIKMVANGASAYLASQWGLAIVDTGSLTLVGSIGFGQGVEAYDVAVSGNYAYAACGSSGLKAVDISDPSNPVLVSSYAPLSQGCWGVYALNSYVYTAFGYDGLHVLDAPTLQNPRICDTLGKAFRVAASGSYLYIGNGSAGLCVVDVSNPTSPQRRANFGTPSPVLGISISGTRASLAETYSGLDLINIASPSAPTRLGSCGYAGDEAILNYAHVEGTTMRHVSVDANNDVWVGSYDAKVFNKLSGITGLLVPNTRISTVADSVGGYGGFVDGYGFIWSSSGGSTKFAKLNPSTRTYEVIGQNSPGTGNYGMALDPLYQDVYITCSSSPVVSKYDNGGNWQLDIRAGLDGEISQGATIDFNNNLWVAHQVNSAKTLGHTRLDGSPGWIGNVPLGRYLAEIVGTTGAAVDSNRKVWAANYDARNLMRIDPGAGAISKNGVRVGRVDLTVDLADDAQPYNYSDMTGFVYLGSTSPSGIWDFVQDGGLNNAAWNKLSWVATVPTGTSLKTEVRAADDPADLPGKPFITVNNNVVFSGVAGRYLEVRVTLSKNWGIAGGPQVTSLTVYAPQ